MHAVLRRAGFKGTSHTFPSAVLQKVPGTRRLRGLPTTQTAGSGAYARDTK